MSGYFRRCEPIQSDPPCTQYIMRSMSQPPKDTRTPTEKARDHHRRGHHDFSRTRFWARAEGPRAQTIAAHLSYRDFGGRVGRLLLAWLGRSGSKLRANSVDSNTQRLAYAVKNCAPPPSRVDSTLHTIGKFIDTFFKTCSIGPVTVAKSI
jgi:hypothetical protein